MRSIMAMLRFASAAAFFPFQNSGFTGRPTICEISSIDINASLSKLSRFLSKIIFSLSERNEIWDRQTLISLTIYPRYLLGILGVKDNLLVFLGFGDLFLVRIDFYDFIVQLNCLIKLIICIVSACQNKHSVSILCLCGEERLKVWYGLCALIKFKDIQDANSVHGTVIFRIKFKRTEISLL